MNLTRTQILKGNYLYPSDLIRLRQSKHFVERLEERGIGLDCIPTVVRVSKDNIHSAKADGKELVSVAVRLKYNSYKYVFLVIDLKDGCLKTVWFKEKGKNGSRKQADGESDEQAVRDSRLEGEV